MGERYSQITQRDRYMIDSLRRQGFSLRTIAGEIGFTPGTVSRELARNSKPTKRWPAGEYDPERAHQRALRRRRRGRQHKLALQPALRALVRDYLAMGWSPQQIAGRLKREEGRPVISHESIYRFIYFRSAQKDYWHKLLPRAKNRRGRLGLRGGSPIETIKRRVCLAERPHAAENRQQPGHWEADLMLFGTHKRPILVAAERTSRFIAATKQPNKASDPTINQLAALFRPLPPEMRRTLTVDNGTEFAYHYRLNDDLGVATYFCDRHAPWQKGGVENAIGRLRRWLPRKTDISAFSQDDIDTIVQRYNNTPRKCLGYRTPEEVYNLFLNRVALQT